MSVLLLVVATLALLSGGLKLRSGVRAAFGGSSLAAVEFALGLITAAATGAGVARQRGLAWPLVVLTLLVVVISSTQFVLRVLERHRKREASEGDRLNRYLRSQDGGKQRGA